MICHYSSLLIRACNFLQMSIQHNLLLHPIRIQKHHSLSVELRVSLMNDTVVVWTYDHLIVGIVVQAFDIVINVVRFRDVSAELLTYQLPAELTAIPVEKFEVLSYLSIQLPDPRHPLIDNETCIGIDKIKVRFNAALLLVFDQFSEFLQIACNNRFQNIAVIVLCRINREVLFYGFRELYLCDSFHTTKFLNRIQKRR